MSSPAVLFASNNRYLAQFTMLRSACPFQSQRADKPYALRPSAIASLKTYFQTPAALHLLLHYSFGEL
jgi:hypothetical protein